MNAYISASTDAVTRMECSINPICKTDTHKVRWCDFTYETSEGEGDDEGQALNGDEIEAVADLLDMENEEKESNADDARYEVDDVAEEAVVPRVCVSPGQPSRKEIEEHEVAYIPYRSWCAHCVRGRGRSSPHFKGVEKPQNQLPTIAMDFGFLGEEDRKTLTSLAVRDTKTGAIHGFQMAHKGISDERIAKKVARWIDSLGYKRAVIKSDQEPAIVAFRNEVHKNARTELVPEWSPVKDSQSNGAAENAVKELAGMIRTLKDMVEEKAKIKLNDAGVLLAWIIDYAGTAITRCKVGSDGKTAYQRLKGKSPTNQVTAIGEKVLYMPVKKNNARLNKMEAKFKYGIWLGVSHGSFESLIGTPDGVFRSRVVRRLAPDGRWDADLIMKIKGMPWGPEVGEAAFNEIDGNQWGRPSTT